MRVISSQCLVGFAFTNSYTVLSRSFMPEPASGARPSRLRTQDSKMATQHQRMEIHEGTMTTMDPRIGAASLMRRIREFATKKRLVFVGMVPAGISLGYLFCLGCAAGFVICKLCGGAEAGIQGRVRSIIIPLRNYELHLHHWVLSLVAAIASAIQGFFVIAPGLFYGVLGGLILQGILCYSDWHHIVKRRSMLGALEPAE